MKKYNPKTIESKWQKYWKDHPKLSAADEKSKKSKFYCLDMFPYPSGDGLHVGHVEGYTASDVYSRYQRMIGRNVLHPIGWDAFGLPAENYAIKTGTHPAKSTQSNIKNFTGQIESLGLSYDWSREIDTSSPEYYKWTQWFFLFLYKNGLAYRKKAKVNWCESCQTVLANEQAEGGICERCKKEVVQKDLEQWFFRITDFAEELISGLDKIDWPESTKIAQRNWIGRSEGATIKFPISNTQFPKKSQNPKSQKNIPNIKYQMLDTNLEVFTTRLDTIYGCTYCVVAPEHPILQNSELKMENRAEVEKYIKKAKKKTDLQRTDLAKEKTGVELKGVKAVNPFTEENVPIFVADYVLSTYGTGAVMAVPAHDERDFEFARKHRLPVKQVIVPDIGNYQKTEKTLKALLRVQDLARGENIKVWLMGGLGCAFNVGMVYRDHDDLDLIVKTAADHKKMNALLIRNGFKRIESKKPLGNLTNGIFQNKDGVKIDLGHYVEQYGLRKSDFGKIEKKLGKYRALVLSRSFQEKAKRIFRKKRFEPKDQLDLEYLEGKAFSEKGILINSSKYSGMSSQMAQKEMTTWLEKNKLGKKTTTYKLRDWLISRQRYWGTPIPVIYCRKCPEIKNQKSKIKNLKYTFFDNKKYAIIPVPEKDLPVKLPTDVDFRPKGESPLKLSRKFHNVKCPVCGTKAMRESDTMDTFVCSSWYFFRFADSHSKKEFAAREKIKKWLPVDLYIGGAEHVVLHLLYSRFFTKALHKYKCIDFSEPFTKLRHQGMVLAEDGRKMSKSLGNVINPDEIVKEYGADVLRLYEMFMGPLEDSKYWNTKSIVGLKRFLERVWKLKSVISDQGTVNNNLENIVHKTIKKVTEDIESLRFNTAISSLMILLNEFENQKKLLTTHYSLFIQLLSPFAPHIAEEIWHDLGHKPARRGGGKSIFLEKWPKYNPKVVVEKELNIVIQVNGKVRDQISVSVNVREDDIKKSAFESEKIKKYIPDTDNIKKIIFVPGRLINFVV